MPDTVALAHSGDVYRVALALTCRDAMGNEVRAGVAAIPAVDPAAAEELAGRAVETHAKKLQARRED
jgi:hypothetical protein